MVSTEGEDDPKCLNTSFATPCKTINYVIRNGFRTVCLNGTFYNSTENLDVLGNGTGPTNIDCKQCIFEYSQVTMPCNTAKACMIFIKNFVIRYSTIILGKGHVIFSNVLLENVIIQSNYTDILDKGYMQIEFYESTLYCFDDTMCGIELLQTTPLKLSLLRTQLMHFAINLDVREVMLIMNTTTILNSKINVKSRSPEYLRVPTVIQFWNVAAGKENIPPETNNFRVKRSTDPPNFSFTMVFDVTNPYITISKSQFFQTHIEIHSEKQNFEPILFSILIEDSYFVSGSHGGNGGALSISSKVQGSKVTLISCIFSNNTASKGTSDSMGRGGGLSVEANSLELVIQDSLFVNNEASDLGLSVHISQGVTASLTNCNFEHNIQPNDPFQQALLFAAGMVTKFAGKFHVTNARPDAYKSSINIFYLGTGKDLSIEIHCPEWYKHVVEHTSVSSDSQTIPDVRYECSPCSDNYYTTVSNKNVFIHDGLENSAIQDEGEEVDSCIDCEYGSICSGNDVNPRPNYWGSWHEGELVFYQCPAGYCCSSSDDSTCMYDYCAGNKTSTLCGACQEGFSVAILTGACTPDSQCGEDQWFWLIAILITVAYALWYTFKDDIFAMFFASIKFMKKLCSASKVPLDPYRWIHFQEIMLLMRIYPWMRNMLNLLPAQQFT